MTRNFNSRSYRVALISLFGFLFLSKAYAQNLDTLKLHSVGIAVNNVEKSLPFYQELLGLPVQSRTDSSIYLRLGDGPQYLSLSPVTAGGSPRITHIGFSANNFKPQAFTRILADKGYTARPQKPGPSTTRLELANTYWIDSGVLYFVDQEGVQVQLMDSGSCGPGNANCDSVAKHAAEKLSLRGINHFTTFVSNSSRAVEFYRDLLALGIQSYQGTTPAIAVGDGFQFLMFVGGAQSGPPKNPANIHHVSFSVENFNVDGIFSTLKDYGLTPRPEGANPAPPLTYYVSLRMPERGGAEGGTPEVYFTDPDGILLQVQDPSYCGGGGYLGEKC